MRVASLPFRLCFALVLALLGSGCALPVQGEIDQVKEVAHYATAYRHVIDARANLLERALADCSEKTLKAETTCVRQGVDAAPSVAALIALVPNCRAGQVCHYDHATRERLGFVEASATEYVKRWRIDLDFRHPASSAAQVPVTVKDRDDFDSGPSPATPG